jgi:hypothetical protein
VIYLVFQSGHCTASGVDFWRRLARISASDAFDIRRVVVRRYSQGEGCDRRCVLGAGGRVRGPVVDALHLEDRDKCVAISVERYHTDELPGSTGIWVSAEIQLWNTAKHLCIRVRDQSKATSAQSSVSICTTVIVNWVN